MKSKIRQNAWSGWSSRVSYDSAGLGLIDADITRSWTRKSSEQSTPPSHSSEFLRIQLHAHRRWRFHCLSYSIRHVPRSLLSDLNQLWLPPTKNSGSKNRTSTRFVGSLIQFESEPTHAHASKGTAPDDLPPIVSSGVISNGVA